jgi:hypothetical protein
MTNKPAPGRAISIGSASDARRAAATVKAGLEQGARQLVAGAAAAGPLHIARLSLNLPAGAGEADIARALREALAREVRLGRAGSSGS